MKIHLISHTKDPLKSIASACLNIGIGEDVCSVSDISREKAIAVFNDTISSWLTSPLEFASFNFFWEDIPLFLRSELERARVGWSYAERSMRFYQAEKRDPIDKIDWKYFPSVKTDEQKKMFKKECLKEMQLYESLKVQGIDTQEARCVIGSWYGTALQTATTFRALRDTMAVRISSQAHPGWRDATSQIKKLVSEVDPVLGDALVDICEIHKRCVWHSKLDRPCEDCIGKPWAKEPNHVHDFSKGQCACGEFEPKLNKKT